MARRVRAILAAALAVAVLLVAPVASAASTVHVAPGGAAAPDGSRAAPFGDIGAAIAALGATGGEVLLLPGRYGAVTVAGQRPAAPVTVRAETPGTATLDRLTVRDSADLTFAEFRVHPPARATDGRKYRLVEAERDTARIVFRRLEVQSAPAVDDYPRWSREDWLGGAVSGIALAGEATVAEENRLRAVWFGITSSGDGVRILGNRVEGFAMDGLRALGDGALVEGNLVADAVRVNDNHDDAFQSWSLHPDTSLPMSDRVGRGVQRGLTLRRNIVVSWLNPEPSPLYSSALQGFGLFSGIYEDLVIENNLIVVDHWNGIAVNGTVRGRIVHNTVVRRDPATRRRPWIRVGPTRDGRPSREVTLAGNIAESFAVEIAPPLTESARHRLRNLAIGPHEGADFPPVRAFVGRGAMPFAPLPGGVLADGALAEHAPAVDLLGRPRNDGQPDIGALEAR